MNTDLISYYQRRAHEYEKIYAKPERQHDLKAAVNILQEEFAGKNIIEIACGTGYWTERIAKSASSILATDINESVLEIAKGKSYDKADIKFAVADFNNYKPLQKQEGLFAGFIWSHIMLQDIPRFLTTIDKFVIPGGRIAFIDNNYVEGSSLPITQTDEQGNSFQTRKLEDGSNHLVLKNFPAESFIRQQLSGFAENIRFINLQYYWLVVYESAGK